jgi:ABC-2 type transport system permease protein
MSAARAASFLWFVAHDLRLSVRAFEAQFRGLSRAGIVAILSGAVVVAHALAWPAARQLQFAVRDPGGREQIEVWIAAGVVVSLSMILAQAMVSAMRMFYARADFELIFTAPVSTTAVLGSRALAVAFEGAATAALLLLPMADIASVLDRPAWLAIYPWLLATALGCAGVGLVSALGFFVALGPRRARLYLQVAATLVGASFLLVAQAFSLLPATTREMVSAAIAHPFPGSWLDHRGTFWFPVRAAMGDPPALLVWLSCGIATFLAAVAFCGSKVSSAAAAATVGMLTEGRKPRARPFHGGVAFSLRRKERKLIARDPWLLSQILLQVIYVAPMSIVLWRGGGVTGTVEVAVAPSIVVIASQLSGSLAWVMISGEDAPEFLASAPLTRKAIDLNKLEAIALPIGLFLALPTLALAYFSPRAAIIAACCAAGAGTSAAMLNFWRQAPAKRSMVLRRHSQSRLVALTELVLTVIWAVACAVSIMTGWIGLAVLTPAIVILWLSRPRYQVPKEDALSSRQSLRPN